MRVRHILLAGLAASLLIGGCRLLGIERTEWAAGSLRLTVDGRGRVIGLVDENSGRGYRADAVESPLLSVQLGGVLHPPRSFSWEPAEGIATLHYPGEVTAQLQVTQKPTHLVLELLSVVPLDAVELVVWGPYATTISDTIGETVGVVRDASFAMGIQALNPKTLGGLPWRDNDFPPQVDLFESGDYSDLSEEGRRYVLYRVEAAKPEDFGSTLQAYCRDRGSDRVIANWNHDLYTAPRFEDGGVLGTKIALFGAPTEKLLETIGTIELEEGLPHPMIDGEWGKTARSASAAYLILDFGERDIDDALEWTKRAGLRYLYHPEPFRTWGQFALRSDRFPNGREGLRRCVERAAEAGIYLGVHTLSNFITTNDPYVTPVPDPRLAKVGASTLAGDIDERGTEIPVAAPDFFAQDRNNNLHTVVIGEELIQYRAVSQEAPWRLLEPQRGAFGTTASAHAAGESDLVRRPRGESVDGDGQLRRGPVHEFLVRASNGRHPAALHRRRQSHQPLLLAHLHPHELGRAVVRRLPREPDRVPSEEPAVLPAKPHAGDAGLVPDDAGDHHRGRRVDARPLRGVRCGLFLRDQL
jgi:hypothetical protein